MHHEHETCFLFLRVCMKQLICIMIINIEEYACLCWIHYDIIPQGVITVLILLIQIRIH